MSVPCVTTVRRRQGIGQATKLVGVALLSALLISCGSAATGQAAATPTPLPPQPAVEKPTYTVAQGDIIEQLELSGRVAAVLQEDLHFAEAGAVGAIHVRATDPITKGQLLAELDQDALNRQLEEAQFALDQARLTLERHQARQKFAIQRAELDLEEAQARVQLADGGLERRLAQLGVRKAELNLEEARTSTDEDLEQQVAQAQLDYDRMKDQIDAARLYAPFDGEVAAITVQPGRPVEAYEPVMTVMEPTQRELRVENVVSGDISRLSPQQPVTIHFNRYSDTPVQGVIERLPAASNSAARTDEPIHIDFDPGDLELDIGELATVVVTLQQKEKVLWLPPQAIRSFQGRRFVVMQDGDKQRRVDVKLGITGSDRVEIIEGLQEGQVVIGQ